MPNPAISEAPENFEARQPASRTEARRYNVERSCIRCHQKKIRCDKSSPCKPCIRSSHSETCHYPGLERVKRRPRKQVNETLIQEVERFEQIVSASSNQDTHSDKGLQALRRPLSSSERIRGDGNTGRGSSNFTGLLIKDGNFVRYVNDHVLSHVLEKEDEIRSAMTSPHVSSGIDTPGPKARPLSLLHPISRNSYDRDLEGLLPSRRRAIQLWQVFVLNVDPIIKLLHIPSIQPIIYAAINEAGYVTPDLCALLFSIYFSALTSGLRGVNDDYEGELEQFKLGLEISLSQAGFLDQPTMYSLQAMAIFVAAFRRFGSGRSIWTINGTVIRAAQLMGIHRDGKLFNLSPFDQEMRRRLWWKIITTDSRTLEDQGMWITGNHSLGDASMPRNIDDRDIDIKTTDMPTERVGFTEMTPLVSVCHIQVVGEAVAQLSLCADLKSYSEKLPTAIEAIARARSELEQKFFCDYNSHIPVQRLFVNGTRMVLGKLEWRCQEGLLRMQKQLKPSSSRSHKDCQVSTEYNELFTRACELLDASLELVSNEIYESFTWHSSSYLPYELLTFVLWRLYTTPAGPSADVAWQIVLQTFSVVEDATILPDMGPRWTVLCKLKEKVASLRSTSQDRAEMIRSLEKIPPMADEGDPKGDQTNIEDISLDDQIWNPGDLLFPTDWPTFQQNFNIDGILWPQL